MAPNRSLEWVTPNHFRKTVATFISARVHSEIASRQLGHLSSALTHEYYIARPALAVDVADLLRELGEDRDLPRTGF